MAYFNIESDSAVCSLRLCMKLLSQAIFVYISVKITIKQK